MTFEQACEYVGIKPTHRQQRKWHRHRGVAYRATLGHATIPSEVQDESERFNLACRQLSTQGIYDG